MKNNKALRIIIVIIVFIILGLGAWFLFTPRTPGGEAPIVSFPFFGGGTGTGGYVPPTTTATTTPSGDNGGGAGRGTSGYVPGKPLPVLYQLHKAPVAGITAFFQNGVEFARYIERKLGHIYDTDMPTLTETRVSNETFQAVYEAPWAGNGADVAIRQLNDANAISTYVLGVARAAASSATGSSTTAMTDTSVGTYLNENVIAVAPRQDDQSQIFFLQKTSDGVTGIVANADGTNQKKIFTSPVTEWQVAWPSKNVIALTTKPSARIPGSLFFLNPRTGSLTRVLNNIPGLTDLVSPDASKILYAQMSGDTPFMYIFDMSTHKATSLPVATFPEKCAWDLQDMNVLYCALPVRFSYGNYPDDWYQGAVSFQDNIWKINTETLVTERLSALDVLDGIDVIDPVVGPDENTLFFINKKDMTPWRLLLTPPEAPIATSTTPAVSSQ